MATPHTNPLTSSFDNVISLANAQARKRPVSAESTGVINDCRDIALKRITDVLSKTFDTIEDELFEMAQLSPDRETQALYLDARAQAREKRSAIESSFKKQFLSFFAHKVSGAKEETASAANSFDFSNMSLVEDSDLEEKIAVDEIAKRLANNCDEELRALSQRMGFLMLEPELNDDANPMSPDTIIKALQVACDQMTSGYKTKLTVMRMVEQHMTKEMMGVYRDINSHLIARQIMPTIRPTFRKAQNSSPRKSGTSNGAANSNAHNGTNNGANSGEQDFGGATGDLSKPTQDLFATLQQLMSGNAMPDPSAHRNVSGGMGNLTAPETYAASSAFAGFGRAGQGTPSAGNNIDPTMTSAGLISALTQIQQQVMANTAQFSALANMQNFVPGETPLAELNVLRQVKEKSFGVNGQNGAQQGNQIDGMTIDIVAMLFDYVFEDKAIPDTIKALLARLQIPVLKVAILDKSFFSKKSHPARHLLDVLAEASVCFAGQVARDNPLYQKIEVLVDRIHSDFDTDIEIFAIALAEFEQFLGEREAASADTIEKSARVVHENEKREMARLIAVDEVERRIQACELPEPVVAMLRGPWARVLERVYLRDGGRNQHFMDALEGADDLAWSVAPKMHGDERKRLVSMLPLLLKRLQEGMDIAAVEQTERERFFSALVDCHAVAVKAGLRGESITSLFAATQPPAAAAPLFEKLINEERAREEAMKNTNRSGVARIQFTERGVEIEEIVAQKNGALAVTNEAVTPNTGNAAVDPAMPFPASRDVAVNTNSAVDFDITALSAIELKRGTWVEFIHDGGAKVRAKLTWISPLKGVYLFTNPSATEEALSVAPDALQAQFRRGVARIIEESSLIDRAVNRIVNSLSGAAA